MTTASARIPEIERLLDSLGDPRDLRSDNEKAVHYATSNTATLCITNLRSLPANLDRMNERLANAVSARDGWLQKEKELQAAGNDLALRLLRAGTLVRGFGETWGSLGYYEDRVTELTERRDAIQKDLDTWTALAEQLLSAPVSV